MPYAIVDIETTGGYASANSITEVAIYVHDGQRVIDSYQTLVNPESKIPYYISGLTGITDKMVAKAPKFEQVAQRIFELLKDNIFVAHSVNFDYSFLKHALADCGYELKAKKLCTIRLGRKVVPGLRSYSLGNFCAYLGIEIKDRHRAGGDAEATVKLFEYLLANGGEQIIGESIRRASKEQVLPPNVPREQFDTLPHQPGVYYFRDSKGKVVYVGKALDVKKRVSSHFSNNSSTRQRQNFLREVYHISCTVCESELAALELESVEIKRLWPKFNQAQKHYEPVFGIVYYYDQAGFRRLAVQKAKSKLKAVAPFNTYIDSFNLLKHVVSENQLCPRLSGITRSKSACSDNNCACRSLNTIADYNAKVDGIIEELTTTYAPEIKQVNILQQRQQQSLNFA